MENNPQERGTIDSLKPKTAFKAGLGIGIGVMFVIGFFVLLGILLNNKTDKNNNDNLANNNVNNNVVDNNDNQPSGQINLVAVDYNKDWVRGDKNAKVNIVTFSDIDCPFCSRFHETMLQILKDYDGKINWTYRHFPLPTLHPEAQKKAEAAECVGEQGGNEKFWAFLDKLFADSTEKVADLPGIVSSLGLNADDFQKCLDSGKYTSKISGMSSQAQAAGAQGTPYSVIVSGNQKTPINGALPIDSIKATLDSILK